MTNEEQGGSLMNQQMQTAPGTAAQPPAQLKTNRSLLKFILLSLITFGIYGIVVMSSISNDINLIAGRYDGKKTMHYFFSFSSSVRSLAESPLSYGIINFRRVSVQSSDAEE